MKIPVKRLKRKIRGFWTAVDRFIQISSMKKRKFNVGAGNVNRDKTWYATDIRTLDITQDSQWWKHLLWLRLDNIMAEHVWEHLSDEDTELANRNCFKYLKRAGTLRLAVPDGYHPDKNYIDYVKPGGHGLGADDHKILYTYKTLTSRLEKVGFKVMLLEYWDENGQFHFVDWTDEGGRISRSKRYDSRNSDGKLNYTSLIVDAVKI